MRGDGRGQPWELICQRAKRGEELRNFDWAKRKCMFCILCGEGWILRYGDHTVRNLLFNMISVSEVRN